MAICKQKDKINLDFKILLGISMSRVAGANSELTEGIYMGEDVRPNTQEKTGKLQDIDSKHSYFHNFDEITSLTRKIMI